MLVCFVAEKAGEESVWRRHHQQRGFTGECEGVTIKLY